MTDSDLYLAYIVSHEAWYATGTGITQPSITVCHASTEGGVAWEFVITAVSSIGIQLQMFYDSWAAFSEVPQLFQRLADTPPGSLRDVQNLLDSLGFKDDTARTSPYAAR